jgi:hypothetical protein
VYSDFYEIPIPALRFEKVEETDTKVNDTEEKDALQIDHVKSQKQQNDAQQRKADSLASTTRRGTQNASRTTSISAFRRRS